jgi:hypothetical protein
VTNNKVWDPNRVDALLKPCATEIWRFENPGGGWVHPVHGHLGHFRLLSRDGSPPPAWEAGIKDTFFVGDYQRLEIIGRFGPHEGKYMIHCHNLVHEDHDMMTQFQIGTKGCDPCSAPARPLPAPARLWRGRGWPRYRGRRSSVGCASAFLFGSVGPGVELPQGFHVVRVAGGVLAGLVSPLCRAGGLWGGSVGGEGRGNCHEAQQGSQQAGGQRCAHLKFARDGSTPMALSSTNTLDLSDGLVMLRG